MTRRLFEGRMSGQKIIGKHRLGGAKEEDH